MTNTIYASTVTLPSTNNCRAARDVTIILVGAIAIGGGMLADARHHAVDRPLDCRAELCGGHETPIYNPHGQERDSPTNSGKQLGTVITSTAPSTPTPSNSTVVQTK